MKRRDFDQKDRMILAMYSKDPHISQELMAQEIGLKQPSVAARIRKLKHAGALEHQAGMEPFKIGLQMAKIDITTTNPSKVLELFQNCPYFMNGLVVSGKSNLVLFFVARRISTLESIVNGHLRRMPEITSVEFNIVISTAKTMIMPVQFPPQHGAKTPCGIDAICKDCDSHANGRCEGCPIATRDEDWFF
ncbi:MAG: Lrp/AsnC family transcriptional regulator [Candidatus Thermoplasmatota archaeon]|nr:Lrp/AsnC family transcriptional regulator [Candidatus Thermoplasmatota archaeon]